LGFLIFWFGIGALFAMIVSFFTTNIIIQTTVFLITSTIFILATKPLVKKFVDVKKTNTNVFSIIGKKALVIKDIDPIHSSGQIKLNGEVWSAETENDEIIKEGSEVEVLKINGVKAIVKLVESEKVESKI
ncbi:NfeD family protein, partial [bacterium]|nr:NfeD family protein [bacterium]